jgi:hypothetical protein
MVVCPETGEILSQQKSEHKKASLDTRPLKNKMLLAGLAWDHNDTLNHTISPIYQAIRTFDENSVLSSADERS